ncbi:MAG: hypothetical protein VCD34_12230 [Planctomycetota bacterium]
MKEFTKAYKPFASKVFRFFLLVDGVKVVTGVSGDSELSSSSGGIGSDGEKNTHASGGCIDPDGGLPRAVSVPPRKGGKTFLELFPQLFLFPLLIVIVLVLVYVFFGAIAADNRGVGDLLRDIRVGGGHSRQQDAHALAKLLVQKQEKGKDPYLSSAQTGELIELVQNATSGEDELRGYLVLVLGRSGQPQLSLPFLLDLLTREDLAQDLRQEAITGLGLSGDSSAILPLLDEIDRPGGEQSWQSRWLAIWGVVNILVRENPDTEGSFKDDARVRLVARKLKSRVNDSRREISWTAAYYLARYFGDNSGEIILQDMLSWDFLGEQFGDNDNALTSEEQQRWMCQALEGLYRLRGSGLKDVLEGKKSDRNLKVRAVAIKLLDKLEKKT